MKHVVTKTVPNQHESVYWVDLKENPYGGIIKYYDGELLEWVYLDEPRFTQSPASKLTSADLDAIYNASDLVDYTISLQNQIDTLDETKANKNEVLSEEAAKEIHDTLNASIQANSNDIALVNESLGNRITQVGKLSLDNLQEVKTDLTTEINVLKNAVQKGYDDTEIKNALSTKTSYQYVEERIKEVTGVAPDVLDTLEELATALGNDPNFAATITQMVAEKTDEEDVRRIANDILAGGSFTEVDPTVPAWAKRSTKPTYTAEEVGALPMSTFIPNRTSQLTNDAGYLTQLEVKALINANKPLTVEQYNKVNKLDSYAVYDLTEENISLPVNYATIVLNVPNTLESINIYFEQAPVIGSRFRLYVNPIGNTQVNFYTRSGSVLHSTKAGTITRFDITAIDLTDYPLALEQGAQIISEGGSTVIVNILDGYIIDYVKDTSNNLTWYEGS